MKKKHPPFYSLPAALGLMLVLTGCHDKSQTIQLQEEVEKTSELIRIQTIELDNVNKTCTGLGQQLRDFGSKKDELATSAARSTETLGRFTQYREALEKEVASLTEAVAKYRREQLKP
ncbi:MAG: hypothetical protein V4726_18755 [Verrucomicrobiota bacterium]